MAATKRTNRETAEQAYRRHRTEIEVLMEALADKLETHGTLFSRDLGNWGYVGDVAHVADRLREITTHFVHGR